MRLDKYLAESYLGSRKKVRNYVQEGKVCVNDEFVLDPAFEIQEGIDRITYQGVRVIHCGKKYYMFHKPVGYVTARIDDINETIFDLFSEDDLKGLFPVGRLDKDTEGLLLLTNDGEFNHRLMYPDQHVEKTYFFWAFGSLGEKEKNQLKLGIDFEDGKALAKALNLQVVLEGTYDELCDQMQIENIGDKKKNLYHQQVVSGYITIDEGRKHQVKRMIKAVGCYIVYLKRISIGELSLDESLSKGAYRELSKEEIKMVYEL